MVKQAGYEEIAARIDQQAIANQLIRLEPEIVAKYLISIGRRCESGESHKPTIRLDRSRSMFEIQARPYCLGVNFQYKGIGDRPKL
jgi:hypothetical protein